MKELSPVISDRIFRPCFAGIFYQKRTSDSCGEMKPLRLMSIHKSVCVTSFNDVYTEAEVIFMWTVL